MPDVATNRTRDVSISGTGSFGLDSLSTFGGPVTFHRILWFATSEVQYWGKSVSANIDVADGGTQPSVTLRILYGGFTKSVTVNGTFHAGATFQASQDAGTYAFTEVVHCVQHVNPNPYEVRTGVSFTCSASISVTFTDTTNGGGSQTVSASLTMTDTDIAGFASETYSGYDYTYSFNGIPVHFDLAATIGFDSPGLISAFAGVSTNWGKPQLTGNGAAVSWHWNGATSDVNAGWNGSDQPSAAIQFFPSWALSVVSNVYHYADGTEVGATLNHYYGTDLVGSFASGSSYRYPASGLIDYVNVASFTTGQNRAGTGFQSGSPLATDANYDSLGGLIGGSYSPVGLLFQKPGDPIGAATSFRVDPVWANGYATYTPSFHPTPPPTSGGSGIAVKVMQPYQQGTLNWAALHRFGLFDVQGIQTTTTADVTSSNLLPVVSSAGMVAFDSVTVVGIGTATITSIVSPTSIRITAVFAFIPSGTAVIDTTRARWVPFGSGPTFPGVTAAWDTAPGVSLVSGTGIDGNALQVVSTGPASVGTELRYLLKHQGFRYAHLRVSALPPSATVAAPGTSAGATDLPVASEAGFHIGDSVIVDAAGTPDTVTVSGVAAGHLTVGAMTHAHAAGVTVARTSASRVMFSLQGSSVGTVGWLVTPPADGSWSTVDLDLAKPDYKVAGSAWVPATDLVPPALFFPDLVASAYFGAQVAVMPLDAGTFTFDYLEGYRKTDGTRTPLLFFPFLDGRGDPWGLQAYEDADLGAWTVGVGQSYDQSDLMRWVVNGVHGATLRGVTFPTPDPADVAGVWTKLYNLFDTTANDTGITVVKGVAGDPDPLSVFGPLNQGQFNFDPLTGYGLKPTPGTALTVHGQLREFPVDAEAYYGAGDLMSATGGYGAVVVFALDWLFDGEAIVNAPSGGISAILNDNDTGTAIVSGTTDDDGMARLPAKYGVVYPYDNITGAAQWSAGPPGPPDPSSYTALGKLLNSDWLSGAITPVDSSGYLVVGSPPVREAIVILDRYQTFVTAGGAALLGLTNLESARGQYLIAYPDPSAGIRFQRSNFTTPPFIVSSLATTNPADREPKLAIWKNERIILAFARAGSGIMETVSTDHGLTWSEPTVSIPGAKHPELKIGASREVLRAGVIGTQIQGTVQEYGDASESAAWVFLDTMGAPLAVVDDAFSLAPAVQEAAARWLLIVRIAGEAAPSNWWSSDGGKSWVRTP